MFSPRADRVSFIALLFVLGACDGEMVPTYEWDLPEGFPTPRVPEDNPMSEAKVTLGRMLFYDPILSGNQTQACASCHRQDIAFTDGLEVSVGSTGESTPRSSMAIVNVAYNARLTWANPILVDLEDQALVPMFGENPVELGTLETALIARLRDDPMYPELFHEAFPGEADPVSIASVVRAIASFERTMLSVDSLYDRYTYRGDDDAMSPAALRGLDLFFSERLECFHCHGGFNFSDGVTHTGTVVEEIGFHNTGLYNIDGRGGYPAPNRGLYEQTEIQGDMGRFRAPTLRNITVTAPYMHDGSIATLDEVLDHYAAAGRTIETGPNAGVGSDSPLRNVFIHGFELTDQERADMHALFEALRDDTFLTDPRFASPF